MRRRLRPGIDDLLKRFGLIMYRHRLDTSVAVILLRPKADTPAMTGTLRLRDRLGSEWGFPFHVVRIWEIPVEKFLAGPLGLLPFAPLAKLDPADAQRVKAVIERRIKAEASRTQAENLRTALVQLLALRYDVEGIAFWSDLMGTLDISNTPLANKFRKEGRVERAIEALLDQGAEKFGEPTADVAETIGAIADDARLRVLLKRIVRADSWRELLAE